jgi:indole-3-glycerol phosphate synthase
MFLEKIISLKKEQISIEEKEIPLDKIKSEINGNFPSRSLVKNLKKKDISIIAELKKSSPSCGIIRENYDLQSIASDYEKNGASAISVLTEKNFFLGNDDHISNVKEVVNLPILRKDFIISEYQIYQSKKIGADAILLISSCLEKDEINKFIKIARSINLECVVEIHSDDEIKKIEGLNIDIIGINNRDLKTFEVNIETSYRLKDLLPKNSIVISESGITSSEHIRSLKSKGFNGVLIGEVLMKSPSPGKKLRELLKGIS